MTYDVHFFSHELGQDWSEAFEAADLAGDDGSIPDETWQRIVEGVQAIDSGFVDDGGELVHENGMMLVCTSKSGGLNLPYWHTGELGKQMIDRVFALAEVVERETGLSAYDPQLGKPVADLSAADRVEAAGLYISTSAHFRSPQTDDPGPSSVGRRPRWKFWAR